MMEMNDIAAMFESPVDDTVTQIIAIMAESIALDDDKLNGLKAAAKDLEESVKARKRELAILLISSGMDSVKLASGLSPKAKTVRRYFKAAGVTDEQLHAWLRDNDLGGIIQPTVHFQTMQSTLAQYEAQDNTVPADIFTVSDEPTVTMYGKSKFLNSNSKEQ
jgi:hypothetical protein